MHQRVAYLLATDNVLRPLTGLDHRVGHPTPFEPIPMLVAAD
jgi:hypothetical protein